MGTLHLAMSFYDTKKISGAHIGVSLCVSVCIFVCFHRLDCIEERSFWGASILLNFTVNGTYFS